MKRECFTIRIKPYKEEVLSSYIMRMIIVNKFSLDGFLQLIKIKKVQVPYLDILPHRVVDINKLCTLLGLNTEMLEEMTFTEVYRKFGLEINTESDKYRTIMNEEICKKARRFCPQCLRENNGYYKTIWQVNEIQICDIHRTKLISDCLNCDKTYSYFNNGIGQLECAHCNEKMYKNSEDYVFDDNFIKDQMRMYKEWRFILNASKTLFPPLSSLNGGYTKAIPLYFLISQEADRAKKSVTSIVERNVYLNLLWNIEKSDYAKSVTLNQLFSIIRKIGFDIEKLSEIYIPDEFIKNPLKKEHFEVGPCLSPWCHSYGSNKNMVRVKEYRFHRTRFLPSVCTECYMKFGYERKGGEWITLDNKIDQIWETYLPLLKRGITYTKIYEKTGNTNRLDYAIGYSINHGLISSPQYYPPSAYQKKVDLVDCFRTIASRKGLSSKNARELYGWDSRTYNLYLTSKEVQDFILFSSHVERSKKKWSNNDPKLELKNSIISAINKCKKEEQIITIKLIASMLSVSLTSFHKYKLVHIIKREIELQKEILIKMEKTHISNKIKYLIENDEGIKKQTEINQLCKYSGVSYSRIKRIHPEIYNEISKIIDSNIKLKRKQKEQHFFSLVTEAILILKGNGEKITYQGIVNYLNIGHDTLKAYPIIMEFIYKAIDY